MILLRKTDPITHQLVSSEMWRLYFMMMTTNVDEMKDPCSDPFQAGVSIEGKERSQRATTSTMSVHSTTTYDPIIQTGRDL